MINYSYYNSPIGKMLLASENGYLIGLWFENQKYYKSNYQGEWILSDSDDCLLFTKKWLDDYFSKKNPSIQNLKLNPKGTKFQKEVWSVLLTIPYGKTMTYGDIAKRIAYKRNIARFSSQAVGQSVGHNPISIIIPCHRVIGSNHSLTGYAGGIDKKSYLLTMEEQS